VIVHKISITKTWFKNKVYLFFKLSTRSKIEQIKHPVIMKKASLIILTLLSVLLGYAFQKWYTIPFFQDSNILSTWFDSSTSCNPPAQFELIQVTDRMADIKWEDNTSTSWQYFVQPLGSGLNNASKATTTTSKSINITTDCNQQALLPDTVYEVLVRSLCSDGTYSDWADPFIFKTNCAVVTSFPLVESFGTNSTTKSCWTIVDHNKDYNAFGGSFYGTNVWTVDNGAMFHGTAAPNDDYLISPALDLDGGVYAISYSVQAIKDRLSEYEILLSTNGNEVKNFTQVVASKVTRQNITYETKTHYVSGIKGTVHIAWHVTASQTAQLNMKDVVIEKVDCIGIEERDVEIQAITKNSIAVSWKDPNNTSWETFVQPKGQPAPTGSGAIVTTPSFTRTSTSNGTALQPATEYEFYLKTSCGTGKKGKWLGPFVFKTACNESLVPFTEGFNTNSTTRDCWTIIDANKDWGNNRNIWFFQKSTAAYEGDSFAYFNASIAKNSDDWLISPIITGLNPNSIYRLRYRYKGSDNYEGRFEVLTSTTGIAPNSFKTTLLPLNTYSNTTWLEHSLLFKATTANINIAWHVMASKGTQVSIDYVRLEEVKGCIEPVDLEVTQIEPNQVTIKWDDKYNANSSWEYIVQKVNGGNPTVGVAGTATTNKSAAITKDKTGAVLSSNTLYEYYVRSACGGNTFSDWAGPFVFRTSCPVFSSPFKENFEEGSLNLNCWNVLMDDNTVTPLKISILGGEEHKWFVNYGGHSGMGAQLNSFTDTKKESWLVSPTLEFKQGKTYRLKYKIKIPPTGDNKGKLEVVASTKGIGITTFTTLIVPAKHYNTSSFEEEIYFISQLSGQVHLAWHSLGIGPKQIALDDVSIEEVQNCPEPLKLGVKNIETNQAELTWTADDKATQWEYWVQLEDQGDSTGNGTLTKSKNPVVQKEQNGKNLEHNTTYEYYVRTKCADGTYSIWSGPFVFTTDCGVFTAPFYEGFNTTSKTVRCWTAKDAQGNPGSWKANNDKYEGDRSFASNEIVEQKKDHYLISPTVRLTGGTYLLKYNYKAPKDQYIGTWKMHDFDNNLEVLLSEKGHANLSEFKKVLLPSTKLTNESWKEQAVLIQGVNADVNIAWRVLSEGKTFVAIDNVRLEKVENCVPPIDIEVKNTTGGNFDITWKQLDTTTNWEVVVVPYKGSANMANPVAKRTVTGTPATTIANLPTGVTYTVYVRAICDSKNNSEWSSGFHFQSNTSQNNGCVGAIDIPVNPKEDCVVYTPVSFKGATLSTVPLSPCYPATGVPTQKDSDAWFSFTATNDLHVLALKDMYSETGLLDKLDFVMGINVYDQNCTAINGNTISLCLEINEKTREYALTNLTIGHKYYIRINVKDKTPDYRFNICITTPSFVEVSESGAKYTTEELVRDVLIGSDCNLVSNISYQNGNGDAASKLINTFGYFNVGTSKFPFKEGIVLSTNEVKFVPGPYRGYLGQRGDNLIRWEGDKDINDAILDAGGGPRSDKRVTQVEFDFISVKDSVSFEYLFASNSYHKQCGDACSVGALFAAWLIDTKTGEGQNLAKIPHTNTPIALNTIRDNKKSGIGCNSANANWYWKHYDNNQDNPLEAFIDFVGMTKPMQSQMVKVVPGRKYHIKLAVMDFCTSVEHSSAVFFNAGSFNLGDINLGKDWTVENQSALCTNESRLLKSGIGDSDELNVAIQWFKDGKLLEGENKPDLLVNESGVYKIHVNYLDIDCEGENSIKVEMYEDIKKVVPSPAPIEVCRYSLESVVVSLDQSAQSMLKGVDQSVFGIEGIFETETEANEQKNAITNTAAYSLGKQPKNRTFYIRVVNKQTQCFAIFELKVVANKGDVPQQIEDVLVCKRYVLPALAANQKYFSESGGQGKTYQAGDVLEAGVYTIYLLQMNQDSCFEEISFKVTVTAMPELQQIEDKVLECEFYVLPKLLPYNKYYIEKNGERVEVFSGHIIRETNTRVYIVVESADKACYAETSFTVTYNDCPIPKGISPNGDHINDALDLSLHAVSSIKIFNRLGQEVYSFTGEYTNQWKGQSTNGKDLPSGTYYYVIMSYNKTRTGWIELNR
jgi:gliding motility-associated-like protein